MSGDTMASSLARRLLRMLAELEQEHAKRTAAARRTADADVKPQAVSIYDGPTQFQQEDRRT